MVQRLLDRAAGSVTVASHTLEPPVDGPTGPEESRAAAGAALVAALEGAGAERTRHGWLLLPDAAGCGPIYCCVLHKAASCDFKRVKVNKYARDRPGSEEEERAQQVLQREQRRGRRQRRPDLELTGESEEP